MKELNDLIRKVNEMRCNFNLKKTDFGSERFPLIAIRHYIRFFRIYIPKNEKDVRPLGVPTLAWRVFLKMWLIPTMGFTGHFMPTYFHGYLPGRGTATAWKEILKNVIHAQNIYELDFKGFFPSIPTNNLTSFLYEKGHIPMPVCVFIHFMNNSTPIWVGKDQLEEVHFERAHQHSLVLDQLKLALSKPVVREPLLKGVSTTGLREPTSKLDPGDWANPSKPYDLLKPRLVKGIEPFALAGKGKSSMLIGELERGLNIVKGMKHEEVAASIESVPKHHFDPNFQIMKWKGSKGIPLNRKLSPKEEMEMAQALQSWFKLPRNPQTTLGNVKTPMEAKGGMLIASDIPQSVGLPQGGGLSPYLSILYLEWVLREIGVPKTIKLLFYADDGIFYGDDLNTMERWIKLLQGPSHLKTSLSYYGILFSYPKCKWVKRYGVWLDSLKFLGMRFIPGETLSKSILKAETRGVIKLTEEGLTIKKSNLVYDKAYLVFYTYSMSLLREGLEFLSTKATTIKSPSLNWYYVTLERLAASEVSRVMIDYLYLIVTIITKSVSLFVLFFLSSAQQLGDYKSVSTIAELIESGEMKTQRHIYMSDLDIESKDMVFQTVAWLKGGYDSGIMQPLASTKLLNALSHSFTKGDVPNVVYSGLRFESFLRELMAASLKFYGSFHKVGELGDLIQRQIGNDRVALVPLDLMRFLYNLFIPFVLPFVNQASTWISVTRADKAERGESLYDNYTLRTYYYKLRKYVYQNQFRNLANSEFFGLLQSRMYSGGWRCEEIVQNFRYTYKKDSLAAFLKEKSSEINIFNGSSYAFHEVVRLASQHKPMSRGRVPFKLFSKGVLPSNSWESNDLL